MPSVTQRIQQVKQPYGGYMPVRTMKNVAYDDGWILAEEENVHASIVGIAVDYLFRYMVGVTAEEAFSISLTGAALIGKKRQAKKLVQKIQGLDRKSVICACQLSGFDVCIRNDLRRYRPVKDIRPDESTIRNIQIMVQRCLTFFDSIGPITNICPTFEGGYTRTVSAGDADYMTKDALWELKVSKSRPTSKHTLQLLVYYIMGLHSVYPEYSNVQHLGIFNPRLNQSYTHETMLIPQEVIAAVESNVIGYGDDSCNVSTYTFCQARNDDELINEQILRKQRRKRYIRIVYIILILILGVLFFRSSLFQKWLTFAFEAF